MANEFDEYQLPDGTLVQFPLGTPDADVGEYLRSNYPDQLGEPSSEPQSGGSAFDFLNEGQTTDENPWMVERLWDSTASNFGRMTGSIAPGIKAAYAATTEDQETFNKAQDEIDANNALAQRRNPNSKSYKDVQQTFAEEGIWEGLDDAGDYAADMFGMVLGSAVPYIVAAPVAAASSPAVAATAVAAPVAYSFFNFLSNNIERAEHDGEVSVEDINLLGVVGAAAAQTGLERFAMGMMPGFGKAFRGAAVAGSKVTKDAINSTSAEVVKQTMRQRLGNGAKEFMRVTAAETSTELGQQALERAAAGESITPQDEEDMEEYMEILIGTMVGVGPFGSAGGFHKFNAPVRARRQIARDERRRVELEKQVDVQRAAAERRQVEKGKRRKIQQEELTREAENDRKNAEILERARAEREVKGVAAIDRTMVDVAEVAARNGVDIDSSPIAVAGFHRMVKDLTGVSNLGSLEPSDIDAIYRKVSENQGGEDGQAYRFDMTTQKQVNDISRSLSIKLKEGVSKTKLRNAVRAEVTRGETGFKADKATTEVTVNEVLARMERQGMLQKKGVGRKAKYSVDIDMLHFIEDPLVAPIAYELLGEAQRTVRTGKTARGIDFEVIGLFPSFGEAARLVPGLMRHEYDQIVDALKTRGVIKKKGKTGHVLAEVPEALSNRVEFNRSPKALNKWIVRDSNGNVVYIAKNKTDAEKFYKNQKAANNNAILRPSTENGYVIRQTEFQDEDGGDTRYLRSVPVEFISSDGATDADADNLVSSFTADHENGREEYLGSQGDVIRSDFDPEFVKKARSGNEQDFDEAVDSKVKSVFSEESVLNKYGLPKELRQDLDGAMDNVGFDDQLADGSPDLWTSGSDELSLPLDALGKPGKPIKVTIKEGVSNGVEGFGRARFEGRHPEWRENLSQLNAQIKEMGKKAFDSKSPIQAFAVAAGRVFVTNGSGDESTTYIFDRIETVTPEGSTQQEWHLFNIMNGDELVGLEANTKDAERGLQSEYGPSATAEEVRIINRPEAENIERLSSAEKIALTAIPALGGDSVNVSGEPGLGYMGSWIDDIINDWVPRINGGITPEYGSFTKAGRERRANRRQTLFERLVDRFDPIRRSEAKLVGIDGSKIKAEASALSATRRTAIARDLGISAMEEGYVAWEFVEDKNGNQQMVQVIKEFEIGSEAIDLEVYNPDNESFELKSVSAPDFRPEGVKPTGGVLTIAGLLGPAKLQQLERYFLARRSRDIQKENTELPPSKQRDPMMSEEQIQDWMDLGDDDADVLVAYQNMQDLNERYVQENLVVGGVLSEAAAKLWLKYGSYAPLFRDVDGASPENAEIMKKIENEMERAGSFKDVLGPLQDRAPSKKLGTSGLAADADIERALQSPLKALMDNHIAGGVSSSINHARTLVLRNEVALGQAEQHNKLRHGRNPANAVDIRVNGEKVKYVLKDPAMFAALEAEWGNSFRREVENSPIVSNILMGPARALRDLTTRNPGFAFANMIRDATMALLLSPDFRAKDWRDAVRRGGANWFRGALGGDAGMENINATAKLLTQQGTTNGIYGSLRPDTPKAAREALDRKQKTIMGQRLSWKDREYYFGDRIGGTFDKLGRASALTESATREVVFERTMSIEMDNLRREGTYQEANHQKIARMRALERAKEVLNFDTRGNSYGLSMLTSMAPFLNARIQGIDLLARGLQGRENVGFNSALSPVDRQTAIFRRGMFMAVSSAILQMLLMDDDEYEREPGFSRDNNWFVPLPGVGYMKFPIPFEAGFLFKTLPELMVRTAVKNGDGEAGVAFKDMMRSVMGQVSSAAHPGQMLPVFARPVANFVANRDVATGFPIESPWEQNLPANLRFNENTTATGYGIGQVTGRALGYSPKHVDNLVRTLGGTLGWWAWSTLDSTLRLPGRYVEDYPLKPRPFKRMDQQLFFKRFVSQGMGYGQANEFYEFLDTLAGVNAEISMAENFALKSEMTTENRAELNALAQMKPLQRRLANLRKRRRDLKASVSGQDGYDRMVRELDRLKEEEFRIQKQFKRIEANYYRRK